MRLCRLVAGDKDVELWNNEWIKQNFVKSLTLTYICDAERLKKVTPVITFRETTAYYEL